MRKKFAPWVVFGATAKPSKSCITYVDKRNTAHCHICQLKDDADYEYGEGSVELSDISGEYVHLWFCKKESLDAMIRQLTGLLAEWKREDDR